MTINLETLAVKLTADASQFSGELNKAQSKTSRFAQGVTTGLRTVGAAALGIGAAGMAAVGVAAVKASQDFVVFEQGMDEVFTLMPDISGAAMDEMTQQVKDLSTEFGVMPEEVVPALYQSISAGVPRDNVFDFLETAQKAAAGGVTDLTTSVDGISSVVNAYGDDVISAAEASDLMFTAVRLGKTNFEELSANLGDVNPLASALGVNFGDVTAALAAMTSQGTSTNVATTQMRGLLQELSKAGTEVGDVFSETAGVSFTEFIAQGGNMADAMGVIEQASADTGVPIQDMFSSVEAGMAALQLTGAGAETFSANIDAMGEAAGATDAAFETMDGGLKATGNRLKAMGKVALLDFAGAFEPLLVMAADFAEDLLPKLGAVLDNVVIPAVEAFAGWIETTAQAISAGGIQQLFTTFEDGSSRLGSLIELFGVGEEKAMAIGAAINNFVSSVRSLLGPIVEAIAQFVSWKDVLLVLAGAIVVGIALIVGPLVIAIAKISLIIAGVIAVVAVLRNAWEQNWGDIQGKTTAVWEGVLKPAFEAIRSWLAVNIPAAINTLKAFWEGTLKPALQALQAFIMGTVVPALSQFVDWLQTNIPAAIKTVQQFWQNTLQPALAAIQGFILNTVVPAISSLVSWLSDTLTSAFSTVSDFWTNTLKPALSALWGFIQDDLMPVAESLSTVITEIGTLAFTALQGAWENVLRPALESLWGWIQDNIVPVLETMQGIIEDVATAISDTLSPVVDAIVNGALAALKGALDGIKGALSSVKTWLDRVATTISGVELPGWLQPGSPSPFEQTLINSAAALKDINTLAKSTPLFQGGRNQLDSAMASLPGGRGLPMASMESAGTARNGPQFIMNIHNNSRQEDLVGDFRLMEAMAGGI